MFAATQVVPIMDGLAKYLSPRYPAWQLTWSRFFFHLLALAPVVLHRFEWKELWPRQPFLQLARGACLMVATTLFFASIAHIPLADALVLLFSYPLIVSVLSPMLLGEEVGVGRWAAVAIGFLGVLILLRPGFTAFDWGSLSAVAAGACYAVYILVTRSLSGTAHPLVTLTYTAVFPAIALTATAPLFWVPPRLVDLPYMAAIGIVAAAGHFLLILAFERAPASVLAPLGYAEILMATLIGYVVFHDFPDRWTWVGIAIVIASGIYVLVREQRDDRRRRRELPIEAVEPPA